VKLRSRWEDDLLSLRRLLARRGSYPAIARAGASGRLPGFPVALFAHVGDVYRRVEAAAADDVPEIESLRLAALVHEEPPESLAELLDGAGLAELAPTAVAVVAAFGAVWKLRTEGEVRDFPDANRPHLRAILLFEIAHEGRATSEMERAARVAGLGEAFAGWAERLARHPAT
jgi:hypothetical protein